MAEAGMQEKYGNMIGLAGRGEMIPNEKLLRDRSFGGRQVGHSRVALPLEVERQRNQDGEGYAGDLYTEIVEAAGGIF